MTLPAEFVGERGIRKWETLGRFRSRRNEVRKIRVTSACGREQVYVVKVFAREANCTREAELLSGLSDLEAPVPGLYHRGETVLVLEYLPGPLLLDVIYDEPGRTVKLLGDTLADLYRALEEVEPGLVLEDMNLRNFILDEGRDAVFRVDLESVAPGRITADLGRLCAFSLTYDPPYTPEKMEAAEEMFRVLTSRLNQPVNVVREEVLAEFDRMQERRRITIPRRVRQVVGSW